jgi:ribokinase
MVNVTVLGSINMDVVTNVKRHPVTGETVKGWGTEYYPGGKGANQAVAAHLAGGNVTMIGATGNDPFSKKLLENFEAVGLKTNYILQKDTNSGLAFITVNSARDNNIILSEGANAELSIDDVKKILSVINRTDILLLQNEIPWLTTRYAIEAAYKKGIKIVLNPAPASNVDKKILEKIDVLVLNESEANYMTGIEILNYSTAKEALTKLIDYGTKEVILTLGVNGALYSNIDKELLYTPSFKVRVEDTTAAGDTFIGAFIAEMSTNKPIEDCLKFATAASAITVTKKGAQLSIPKRREIEEFLQAKCETYENINNKGRV